MVMAAISMAVKMTMPMVLMDVLTEMLMIGDGNDNDDKQCTATCICT